jgi:hypothetical protein
MKDSGPSGMKHDNNKRLTIHFDGGFTNLSPDNMSVPDEVNVMAPMWTFQNWLSDDISDEDMKFLYKQAGDGLDCSQRFTNDHCKLSNIDPYSDTTRTLKAGSVLRRAVKGKFCKWEEFTWGFTKVGRLSDCEDKKFNKEHMVGRHCDGPNDFREGYTYSAVLRIYSGKTTCTRMSLPFRLSNLTQLLLPMVTTPSRTLCPVRYKSAFETLFTRVSIIVSTYHPPSLLSKYVVRA